MLHHRQQLDVREAEALDVIPQQRRDFTIAKQRATGVWAEGAGVNLVDRGRGVQGVVARATRHEGVVAPIVPGLPHDGRRARRRLRAKREGIRFVDGVPALCLDAQLVEIALTYAGEERLPDARAAALVEGRVRRRPAIEVANDVNARRIRGPGREERAFHAVERSRMRTQPVLDLTVGAFVEQMQIHIGEVSAWTRARRSHRRALGYALARE